MNEGMLRELDVVSGTEVVVGGGQAEKEENKFLATPAEFAIADIVANGGAEKAGPEEASATL
jgi:hypothetical protein